MYRMDASGFDINGSPDTVSPLYYAVSEGDCQAVDALIKLGSDINATDRWGETLLKMALQRPKSSRNYRSTVQCLIHHGARFNGIDLVRAVHDYNRPDQEPWLVQLLLEHGAD